MNAVMNHPESSKSMKALEQHGIHTTGEILWNLTPEQLIQEALQAKEGVLTDTGALACRTGEHTGRSPQDKCIVRDQSTENKVHWGKVNKAMSPEHFAKLRKDQSEFLKDKRLFVRDAFGGADPEFRIPIRVINVNAWSNLFCRQLFLRPTEQELQTHQPQFTIIHTPHFEAVPEVHGTSSKTFIVANFSEGLILIGGTEYAGEMKKSIFTVLNFLYPERGIMPMHCSANVAESGDENTALFFGLSGTGKTTLSADPTRRLIGDDEHGWSANGIFNFEGGCYAKCINLSKESEPEIFNAIRDGAILENVVIDPQTRKPNYADTSLTENTRAAYPINYIEGALPVSFGGHPKNIVFLTCDAFGVMPPISKLRTEQAMYHFLSGYTAKVAGTEKGMGKTPQTTFSTCFGAPFLPLHPTVYAEMLGKKMSEHAVDCWLLNTGWIGGPYGVGSRIKLSYTRRLVEAALGGELKNAEFEVDPIFGLAFPKAVRGVPSEILNPRASWSNSSNYDTQATDLAGRFVQNFLTFADARPDLIAAGPTQK